MTMMDQETFLNLPTEEVAELVRAVGPQVCVFPLNGTRRWFLLEHADKVQNTDTQTYVDKIVKGYIETYRLCFTYGLDTLLSPVFGGELFSRGDEYIKMTVDGISRVATDPGFLAFYQEHQVRVRFYGDYRKQFSGTPFAYMIDLFDDAMNQTAHNDRYRLFYGVFGNDATETIAEISVEHFQKTGTIPSRRKLVEQYYGEYVDAATLFIGFDKFSVFDYPLLGLGRENLYFTVAPSLYLSDTQLRTILYDHIYLRQVEEPGYANMTKEDFLWMKNFYQVNHEHTQGIGKIAGNIWYPIAQVVE